MDDIIVFIFTKLKVPGPRVPDEHALALVTFCTNSKHCLLSCMLSGLWLTDGYLTPP